MKLQLSFALLLSATVLCGQSKDISIQEGINLYDEGRYEDAIVVYSTLLERDRNDANARYERAMTYYTMGELELAMDDYKKVLRDDQAAPNFRMHASLGYGSILDDQGKGRQAIRIYSDAIDDFGDHYLLYYNRAVSKGRMEDFEGAREDLEIALELNPFHASSAYVLSIYYSDIQKSPSLISTMATWYMVLEAGKERSQLVLNLLLNKWGNHVEEESPQQINVFMGVGGDLNELDKAFKRADMFFTLSMASAISGVRDTSETLAEGAIPVTDSATRALAIFVDRLKSMMDMGSMVDDKEDLPLIIAALLDMNEALLESEHQLTYRYWIARQYSPVADEWVSNHPSKVESLSKWLNEYLTNYDPED